MNRFQTHLIKEFNLTLTIYDMNLKKIWPRLTAKTTQLNFISYLLASLVTVSLYVFINGIQPFTLSILLSVSRQELGNVNGSIVFYDQLLSLALLGSWGALSDRLGRRIIFSSGFLFMGVAMLLFPFSQNIYPHLLLCRLLFAVGAAACGGMVTAVLADYVDERDKGRVSGLVGLMSGVGALFGALCLAKMPSYLNGHFTLAQSIQYSYLISGSLAIVTAFFLSLTLKVTPRNDSPRPFLTGRRLLWRRERRSADSTAKISCPHLSNNDISTTNIKCIISDGKKHGDDADSSADEQTPIHTPTPPSPRRLSLDKTWPPFDTVGSSSNNNNGTAAGRCTFPGVLEQEQQRQDSSEGRSSPLGFWQLVWAGLKLIKNPYIMLAYLGGFVARGDSIIITLFLPLWINNYYIDQGLCPGGGSGNGTDDPLSGDPALHRCAEAVSKAFSYSGIAQSFALIGAPLFGYLAHRMRHRRSISFIVASFVSFCGYTSLFFIRDPVRNAGAIYPLLCVIGLGEIGMIVTSLSLVTSDAYVSPDIRGSVAGCYSLFGGLGLLILTRVGGALTEVWVDSAPFFVVGVLAGLICLIGFVVELVSTKRRVTLSANLMDAADAAE